MKQSSDLIQIRVSGFGGQGVVMMGYVLGKAASIFEGKSATMSQSYGPESRGGASACDVVISSAEIDYPKVTEPDVVVAMSQDAYLTYGVRRPAECTLIIEEELVELQEQDRSKEVYGIPATRMAEGLGNKIVTNMVLLGFLCSVTQLVSEEALKRAIATTVPKGTEERNLKAFEAGFAYGKNMVSRLKQPAFSS
jgi:2-oxoglutarate ferredoxin oxidoreductase subunit gamma